jgi:hypothetical protein
MDMAVPVIQNVPADQVDKYIRLLMDAGAIKVEKRKELGGRYTLIATYPNSRSFSAVFAN